MAEEVLLVSQGNPARARRIFVAFAQRTGLLMEPVVGGVRYTKEDSKNHRVRAVETLRDIDIDWAHHVALGQRTRSQAPATSTISRSPEAPAATKALAEPC